MFGVSADLTPLVVMSVGLLCGSLLGAVTGFGVGLLVDLVLAQTLGVTSLLYIAIGYWAAGCASSATPPTASSRSRWGPLRRRSRGSGWR